MPLLICLLDVYLDKRSRLWDNQELQKMEMCTAVAVQEKPGQHIDDGRRLVQDDGGDRVERPGQRGVRLHNLERQHAVPAVRGI